MPEIPAFGKQRQENHKFEGNLGYVIRSSLIVFNVQCFSIICNVKYFAYFRIVALVSMACKPL
jgi:hypothetical protein